MSITTTRPTTPAQRVASPSSPIFQPQSFGELVQFAEMAARSNMVPTSFKGKPEDIMLAVQLGSEVGLSPMQAIQGIAVINGRPAIWGDSVVGLVRQSPHCENITEKTEGEGDAMVAVCIAKRFGADAVTSRFGVADAKKAGLWNKQGPWTQYPARMLQQRARGFALRDAFADVLKGLKTVEEVRDYKVVDERYDGATIEAKAETVRPVAKPAAEIPPLDEVDTLRDKIDWMVRKLAACPTDIQLTALEASAPRLLAAIEASNRDDVDMLKGMVVDALSAAHSRFVKDAAADYDEEAA